MHTGVPTGDIHQTVLNGICLEEVRYGREGHTHAVAHGDGPRHGPQDDLYVSAVGNDDV
eukprot:XP_001706020.1 Hypothetical protein GL50803_99377 [Giardia lamblia ATCC 50803]